jgi:cobalt/nickel transport system permease protein
MHMADALLSPGVGGAMWLASAATIASCSARVRADLDGRKIPLMGVLGAFVFAVQMINFSIPGTGSSGHLGGALLLALLLGPAAAFVTMASVLVVQALFFADGGLLALGCNLFNMAFIPTLLVFPFFCRNLIGKGAGRKRLWAGTMISAVLASQLGALAVVVETAASGISALPVPTFLLLMQAIHLPIGLVEGVVTAAIFSFMTQARPDLLPATAQAARASRFRPGLVFLLCAVITAAGLSCFASKDPDGLEWSVAQATGRQELATPQHPAHQLLAALQKQTAVFTGYHIPDSARLPVAEADAGTGAAGVAGSAVTLVGALLCGFLLKRRSRACGNSSSSPS